MHSKLQDVALPGCTEEKDIHDIFNAKTGGKTNPQLEMKYGMPVNEMLIAHIVLLKQATHRGIPEPENTKKVSNNDTKNYHCDLEQRKVIATKNAEDDSLT